MKNQNIIFAFACGSLLLMTVAWAWKDFNRDWKHFQRTFYKMQLEFAKSEEEKKSILNQKVEIKQIVLDQTHADRCITCHLALEDTRFKDAPQPFKTHPGKKHHPFEKFGCTICHQGQGLATTAEDAHGHVSFWEKPMLSREEVQSSCNHCHNQIYLEGAPVISRGKELFISLGCHGCHKARGYDNLYKVGPSLRRIANKVDRSWLVRWIKEPNKYQPNTQMPNFRLTEEEAISVAAFLIDQSEQNYHDPIKYYKGDLNKGEKLFRTLGCLGCHKMKGQGNDFAPDLSNTGNKVKPNWLINWFLDPKGYNPNTIMPEFRLSIQEANDLSTYILTVGTKKNVPIFEKEILSKKRIKKGKQIIRKKGCTACHEINRIEHTRIGPELNKFGANLPFQLDFGNTTGKEVERTWLSYVQNKLRDPAIYDTETSKSNMPRFKLSEKDINALAVLLRGMDGRIVPGNFIRELSVREFEIDQGRKAIAKYNCRGCHKIDGQGGSILQFYKGKYNAPPPLEMGGLHVGDRLKDSWMYSFLRKPTPVREWLKVKMPTFMFSQNDIYYITRYFVNFAEDQIPYEHGIRDIPPNDYLIQGRKLVLAFECEECHDEKGSRGPKFSLMSKRLRRDWAKEWLLDTRTLYPGTKMPDHWPFKNGKHVISSKFPRAKSIMGGNINKQVDAIWEYIANYNRNPFLDIELFEEEEEEEEEELF